MNKMIKFGLIAIAVAGISTAKAEEANEYEAIGWTPFAIGVWSPVQIPWGSHTWDVFGMNIGLLWTDAPKMYGIDVTGLASATRDDFIGLKVSGLCNWNTKDVYGVRATLGANIAFGETYGVDMGSFSYREGDFWGLDVNLIGSYSKIMNGVQVSGIVNLASEMSYGCTVAVGGSMAKKAYGLQLAGVFNFTDELHGCQIGLVNFARECPWGFQIGLVNIIMDNSIKVLPIVNCYF